MARVKSERNEPHCNIGTIGYVDYGKTTLTATITKTLYERSDTDEAVTFKNIDKAPEEGECRITISTTHAECETENRYYAHVDCPGHADYVRSMITGAAQMDDAILVAAVIDGVVVQTGEYILLSRQVGVPYIAVFMNKHNIVGDPGLLKLVGMGIRDLLNEYEFPGDDTPAVQGSALKALEDPRGEWGDKILELMKVVNEWVPDPVHEADKLFLMLVEDIFTVIGRGTATAGRVERGTLYLNSEVEVIDVHKDVCKSVATGIEMFRKLLGETQAGDNIGTLLRGVQRTGIEREQCLCKLDSTKCYNKFTAQAYVLAKDEGGRYTPFFNDYHPQFYFRTTDVTGVCGLPTSVETCMPDDNVKMTVELIHPVAMEQSLRFATREGGRTVGSGRVVSIVEQLRQAYMLES